MRHSDKEQTRWGERIALYVSGDLVGHEADHVRQHLQTCEACRSYAGEMTRLRGDLAALADVPLAATVQDAVMRQVASKQPTRSLSRRIALAGALAAVLILIGVLALGQARRERTATAPQSNTAKAAQEQEVVPVTPPGVEQVAPQPVREAQSPATDPSEPIVVKFQTENPNVVIMWLANGHGTDSAHLNRT